METFPIAFKNKSPHFPCGLVNYYVRNCTFNLSSHLGSESKALCFTPTSAMTLLMLSMSALTPSTSSKKLFIVLSKAPASPSSE